MNTFLEFVITLTVAGAVALATPFIAHRVKTTRTLASQTANILFGAMALAYIAVLGTMSLLRHESFHSGGFDLGIFDQNIWNSLHGRPFQNSIAIESPILLGQHFSLLLMSLVPFYVLWADARTLLVVQTLALGFAALPLYWFARKQIGYGPALVVAAAYFLFPSLAYVNLFEFHEVALAVPLLTFALYFLLRQQSRPFLICLALALLVKEEIGFIVAACGGYLFFLQHRRALGIILGISGVVWAVAALLVVIPAFRDPAQGTTYQYVDRYLYLGKNIPEIVTTAITQPGLVLQHLFVPTKIEFVLQLVIPLAFVPLLGGEILVLALPTLGYLLLGDNAFQNSIHFQYTALLIPFIFFATVRAWKRLGQPQTFSMTALLLAGSLVNYYFQAPGPLARQFDSSQYAITPHVQLGHQLLRKIPSDASVMADSNLVPHISDRRFVYQTSVVPDLRQIDYVLADTTLPIHTEYKWIWDDVLPSPFFETIAERDGYIFKKRTLYSPAHPLAVQFDNRVTLIGYTIESALPVKRGDTVSLVLVWRADQEIRERYVVFVHVLDKQGRVVAQGDREPGNGWFRTDRWNVGDVTPDHYSLELPNSILSGDYQILVGLYNINNETRLETSAGEDYSILTFFQVR